MTGHWPHHAYMEEWIVYVNHPDNEWHSMTRRMLDTHIVRRECWCEPVLDGTIWNHIDKEKA